MVVAESYYSSKGHAIVGDRSWFEAPCSICHVCCVVDGVIWVSRRGIKVELANVTEKPLVGAQDILEDSAVGSFEFAVGIDVESAMVDCESWLDEILRYRIFGFWDRYGGWRQD
jgi:hypothetical protein